MMIRLLLFVLAMSVTTLVKAEEIPLFLKSTSNSGWTAFAADLKQFEGDAFTGAPTDMIKISTIAKVAMAKYQDRLPEGLKTEEAFLAAFKTKNNIIDDAWTVDFFRRKAQALPPRKGLFMPDGLLPAPELRDEPVLGTAGSVEVPQATNSLSQEEILVRIDSLGESFTDLSANFDRYLREDTKSLNDFRDQVAGDNHSIATHVASVNQFILKTTTLNDKLVDNQALISEQLSSQGKNLADVAEAGRRTANALMKLSRVPTQTSFADQYGIEALMAVIIFIAFCGGMIGWRVRENRKLAEQSIVAVLERPIGLDSDGVKAVATEVASEIVADTTQKQVAEALQPISEAVEQLTNTMMLLEGRTTGLQGRMVAAEEGLVEVREVTMGDIFVEDNLEETLTELSLNGSYTTTVFVGGQTFTVKATKTQGGLHLYGVGHLSPTAVVKLSRVIITIKRAAYQGRLLDRVRSSIAA